jgi:hypothetical protein
MRSLYLKSGCERYEVYRDQDDPGLIYELAYFANEDALDTFERNGPPEKSRVFAEFCSAAGVDAQGVTIRYLRLEPHPAVL